MRDHHELSFPFAEYQRRLDDLRHQMGERRLDATLIFDPANLYYLTGHQTTGYGHLQVLVVPIDGEPFMVMRLLESTNLEPRTWVEVSRPYDDTGDAIQALWHALAEFQLDDKVLGYEASAQFLISSKHDRLTATLGRTAELVDCSGIVERCRVIKSPLEIDMMRRAAAATVAGMEAGLRAVDVGVNENFIAAEVHHAMYSAGGEYPAVAPYITSGVRSLIGHATWEGRDVEEGDCVFLEIGGCVRRYHTAMMRTVFVGEPPAEMVLAEQLVREALTRMKKVMRTGAQLHEADAEARSVLEGNQTGGNLITRSGYSIGIAFAPSWDEGHILSIQPGESTVLRENMTFHIIPWLHGVLGRHVMGLSETVRITDDGAESFFDTPIEMTRRAA